MRGAILPHFIRASTSRASRLSSVLGMLDVLDVLDVLSMSSLGRRLPRGGPRHLGEVPQDRMVDLHRDRQAGALTVQPERVEFIRGDPPSRPREGSPLAVAPLSHGSTCSQRDGKAAVIRRP